MISRKLSLVALFSSIFFLSFANSSFAQPVGQLFTVTSTADSDDANVGDGLCADSNGQCTLRAAVQEANFDGHTRDVIVFAMTYPSVIDLTQGEIPVTSNLAIVGPGARRLTVERSMAANTPDFRMFRIAKGARQTVIRGMTLRHGRGDGAAILVEEAAGLSVTETFFYENGEGSPGAISNLGTLNISRSLFFFNASGFGGAINNGIATASCTVINSTFNDNTSINDGGAILNNGDLLLINDTFSDNTAVHVARDIYNQSGSVRVLNTIFASNTSSPHSLSGDFISLGSNIVEDPSQARGFENGVNNDQVGIGAGSLNIMLGPLADNGGPTDTMALLAGSPAIDRGNNCVINGTCSITPSVRFRTDQRGEVRVFSTVDVGAYEYVPGTTGTSFGLFFIRPVRPARYLGSIAILTNPTDNTKRYFPMNAFGGYHLPSLSGGTYILEVKTKRAGLGSDPVIISSSDFPPTSFTFHLQGFDVQITSEPDRTK